MKKLRVDLYCGYEGDKTFETHDCFRQYAEESVEDFATRIAKALVENIEQLTFEDEGTEDEDTE